MEWKKLGKIFDPAQFQLSNNCKEFAQSPQTLVFDNFVRIYFSTRAKDNKGEYLSYISFIDMDLTLSKVLNVSKKTVISLGKLGTFDEHGIFPINPFKNDDKIWAYTCGWNRRISVPVDTGIGLAQSFDHGETFERVGNGPVLGPSLNEPFLVGDGFVKKFNNLFYMFYIFGTKWIPKTEFEPQARVYKIGLAKSTDGINWNKNDGKQIITDVLNNDECQALPTVIFIDNKYHMYFCYREATDFRKNKGRGYKIGYAFSYDLENWTRADDESGINLSTNDWDNEMMCYPHIFEMNKKVYLLYNGNEFGKYGFGAAELISVK
jgi:hypothetical protein